MNTHVIDLQPLKDNISDIDLERLSAKNPELKLETNAAGKLIIMSPTGSLTSEKNSELAFQIKLWNKQT
jgi:Uma2 family endonuclease